MPTLSYLYIDKHGLIINLSGLEKKTYNANVYTGMVGRKFTEALRTLAENIDNDISKLERNNAELSKSSRHN